MILAKFLIKTGIDVSVQMTITIKPTPKPQKIWFLTEGPKTNGSAFTTMNRSIIKESQTVQRTLHFSMEPAVSPAPKPILCSTWFTEDVKNARRRLSTITIWRNAWLSRVVLQIRLQLCRKWQLVSSLDYKYHLLIFKFVTRIILFSKIPGWHIIYKNSLLI